jgi:hypothetical protein
LHIGKTRNAIHIYCSLFITEFVLSSSSLFLLVRSSNLHRLAAELAFNQRAIFVLHRECRHLIKGTLLLIDFILRTLMATKTTVPAPIVERDSTFESIFLEGLSRLMTGSLPGLKAMFQRRNEGRDAHASAKGHTLVRGLTVLQTALTYGKKLLECAVKTSKVYVQTPIA